MFPLLTMFFDKTTDFGEEEFIAKRLGIKPASLNIFDSFRVEFSFKSRVAFFIRIMD